MPDGCVDLVFCDPPYDRATLPQYEDLGTFASRVLKPGGSLICYLGGLPVARSAGSRLEGGRHEVLGGRWPAFTRGRRTNMQQWGVIVKHKLMLWFVNGKTRADKNFVHSLVESERDKDHHEWGQGVIEARYYIEHLTPEGGVRCGFRTAEVERRPLLPRRWGGNIWRLRLTKRRLSRPVRGLRPLRRGPSIVDNKPVEKTNGRVHNDRFEVKSYNAAELAAADFQITYLVDGIMVEGQPMILAGPRKSLKTSIGLDCGDVVGPGAGISSGSFRVQHPVRVGFMSGESGRATIKETACRIGVARCVPGWMPWAITCT